jgi:type I restriction enzyme S subunit
LFDRGTIVGTETNYPHLYRLHSDQLVYRKLTAWEGPITIVTPEFEGCHVSSEFPTFDVDKAKVASGFLRFVTTQPWFHDEMKQRAAGTAERRNRLKPADLLEIEISVPGSHVQEAIAAIMSQVDRLRSESEAAGSTATVMAARLFEQEAA